MKKIVLVFLLFTLIFLVSACGKKNASQNTDSPSLVDIATGETDIKIKEKATRDLAIAQARDIFRSAQLEGTDLSKGPCLAEKLIEDWVFDIAHNPRQAIDNKPENQCVSYRSGRAHHFVEFDPQGNLIRAE